jgi:hypothetical protein
MSTKLRTFASPRSVFFLLPLSVLLLLTQLSVVLPLNAKPARAARVGRPEKPTCSFNGRSYQSGQIDSSGRTCMPDGTWQSK